MIHLPNGVYAWWLDGLTSEPLRTLPGHANCRHRAYRLTCMQYEDLLLRSGQQCEVCSLPAEKNASGRLYIDHDHDFGPWAVRGLLCRTCNNTIRFDRRKAERERYESHAWIDAHLLSLGIPKDTSPEPTWLGAITDLRGYHWERVAQGWRLVYGARPLTVLPWSRLVYRLGPHNLFTGPKAARVRLSMTQTNQESTC